MNAVKENGKVFSKIGLSYFLGSIIICIVQMVFINVCRFSAPDFYAKYGFLVAMVPMYLIAIPVMIFIIKRIPAQEAEEKKKMTGKEFFCIFLIAYAGMYLSNIFGNILASVIGAIKGNSVSNGFLNIATTNNLLVNFVIMVLCAPVIEEYIFRKLLIDRTRQYGDKVAIVLSGLMFGLFHGNLYQFCYAFVIGMVLAYVYTFYHDVKYCILLHMVINFMGSIIGILVIKGTGLAEIAAVADDSTAVMEAVTNHLGGILIFLLYFLFILAMVISGIVLFFVNKKKIILKEGTEEINKGEGFRTIAWNAGMGLYILYWLINIIYTTLV